MTTDDTNRQESSQNTADEERYFLNDDGNRTAFINTLKVKTTNPTLSQVMKNDSLGKSQQELLSMCYQSNNNLAKAQEQLKIIMAENIYLKDKVSNIKRHYNDLTASAKAMNPYKSTPYLKYRHNPRNI